MPPLQNFLTAHLKTVDETYAYHFFHASYYFVMLIAAAIFALILALLPFLFGNKSSQIILSCMGKWLLQCCLMSNRV